MRLVILSLLAASTTMGCGTGAGTASVAGSASGDVGTARLEASVTHEAGTSDAIVSGSEDASAADAGQTPATGVPQKAMVTFEFDDGYASARDNAFWIFDAAQMPFEDCIITGRLNTSRYLTDYDVKNRDNKGDEICAHTVNHYDLATLSAAQQQSEILKSQTYLQNLLGHPVTQFAYPFGHHNNQTVSIVMGAGFQSAGTVYGTFATSGTNPFILPRFPMNNTTSISYAHSLIDYAINHKVWIVILFHRVDETGKCPTTGKISAWRDYWDLGQFERQLPVEG
jgi:peptidoglycan/xylan/chitin deacetylase (PgdA/CDA1 family)